MGVTQSDRDVRVIQVTRIALSISSLTILGMTASEYSHYPKPSEWYAATLIMSTSASVYAFLWNLVYLCSTRSNRNFHPGITVSFDLIAWTVLFIFGSFQSINASMPQDDWEYIFDCGNLHIDPTVASSRCHRINSARNVNIGAAVLLLIDGVIHFMLFVKACRDTSKYRAKTREDLIDSRVAEELRRRDAARDADLQEIVQKRVDVELAKREAHAQAPPAYELSGHVK